LLLELFAVPQSLHLPIFFSITYHIHSYEETQNEYIYLHTEDHNVTDVGHHTSCTEGLWLPHKVHWNPHCSFQSYKRVT